MKKAIIIYHEKCMDGLAAAWAAYQYFGETATYIAWGNRKVLPEVLVSLDTLSDMEVYILDFAFGLDDMLHLEKKCKKLVVLDHHESARGAVESLQHHVYGTKKSGAVLAFEYFFSGQPVPRAILYVCDQDTWQHTLPDREAIIAYIYRYSETVGTVAFFDTIVRELETESGFTRAKEVGTYLREQFIMQVKSYAEKAELISFAGYDVYAVNAPSEIRSELGHVLAEKTGTFSIMYSYSDGKWKISFRSVADFDVSVIAAQYGGGGHKNAAACIIETTNPISTLFSV